MHTACLLPLSVSTRIIVPTLQRGNSVRDALRHTVVFRCQVDWGLDSGHLYAGYNDLFASRRSVVRLAHAGLVCLHSTTQCS
ncbi:hypothetical protein DNF23_11915 [Pseudomonas syringae pv. pisi]